MVEMDSLHAGSDVGSDLIDDFFTGGMWEGGLPDGPVLIGRIQQEARSAPGQKATSKQTLYSVRTNQGHVIPDCILLSQSSYGSFTKNKFSPDRQPGQHSKPYPGALCVIVTANGGAAFIIGFFNPPTTIETENDEFTTETNPGAVEDTEARSPGDWIVRTEDASINVKRMGAVVIESGASIRVTMNPRDGTHFSQARTRIDIAEGYSSRQGRIRNTSPESLSQYDYYDKILQRGRTSLRVTVKNGEVSGSVRREVSLTNVNYLTPSSPIETLLSRDRLLDDGGWISEGPKYQWGGSGADEPIVLGNALVTILKRLSSIIKQIKVPTAWGPSGVPLPPTPVNLTQLENDLDDILSEYMFTTKSPANLSLP